MTIVHNLLLGPWAAGLGAALHLEFNTATMRVDAAADGRARKKYGENVAFGQ
jgi:hypothetical protein